MSILAMWTKRSKEHSNSAGFALAQYNKETRQNIEHPAIPHPQNHIESRDDTRSNAFIDVIKCAVGPFNFLSNSVGSIVAPRMFPSGSPVLAVVGILANRTKRLNKVSHEDIPDALLPVYQLMFIGLMKVLALATRITFRQMKDVEEGDHQLVIKHKRQRFRSISLRRSTMDDVKDEYDDQKSFPDLEDEDQTEETILGAAQDTQDDPETTSGTIADTSAEPEEPEEGMTVAAWMPRRRRIPRNPKQQSLRHMPLIGQGGQDEEKGYYMCGDTHDHIEVRPAIRPLRSGKIQFCNEEQDLQPWLDALRKEWDLLDFVDPRSILRAAAEDHLQTSPRNTSIIESPLEPSVTSMSSVLQALLAKLRKRREVHREHKAAKLRERDQERQSDGLLRIALKRHNSMNSFTIADPTTHYRRRQDHDEWVQRANEGGGRKLGRRSWG
ncbi:hypothetical protein AC579_4518 [Pseudocercospora musae]|uniref:Uncharacterized protein n=1 Tax=Pseudocercospora musae TaxID=113226 RepID=A0A139GVG3_9PEZI|nr:hypothetical protein AC579_4518 [Pseudocercospora musae]